MNHGTLIGCTGADAHVTRSSKHQAVARLRVAELSCAWYEPINWIDVVAYGSVAESLRGLGKDSLLAVEYRLEEQVFEEGDVRFTYSQPVAQDVHFLNVKELAEPGDGAEDES